MTTLEIISRLVAVIEPNDPQSEAIKQAVLALLEKEQEVDKPAKPKPAKKPTEGGGAKKPGRKPFDTGKLKALLNGGWSVAKIADEMGVSEQTIKNHMKELGL